MPHHMTLIIDRLFCELQGGSGPTDMVPEEVEEVPVVIEETRPSYGVGDSIQGAEEVL